VSAVRGSTTLTSLPTVRRRNPSSPLAQRDLCVGTAEHGEENRLRFITTVNSLYHVSCTRLVLGLGPQTKPLSMTTHHGLVTSQPEPAQDCCLRHTAGCGPRPAPPPPAVRPTAAAPHDTIPANNNRPEEMRTSCRQQLAPPPSDAAKMSPRISIGPEPVLAAHAPSPPAAGSHCQAREGSAPH